MSEIFCLVCSHGPHTNRQCNLCQCQQFVNAALASSRSLVQLNNILVEKIPVFEGMIYNLLEIVVEAFPDAVARVDARREERRRQEQQEREASQQQGYPTDQEREDARSSEGDGTPDSGPSSIEPS